MMKRHRLIKNRKGKPLVDQFGVPLSTAYGWYEASRYPNPKSDPVAPFYSDGAVDWTDLLTPSEWRVLLSSARYLFANTPVLRGALFEQATLSFPLEPQYTGKDKKWGRKAEEWLYHWRMTCNIRGHPFDSEANSRIRMISRKVDGDIGTRLELDEDTGLPYIRLIEAHRIGDRGLEARNKVKDGPYKGQNIHNGVIYDDYGRTLAYRLLGDVPEEDKDIPSEEMILSFRPVHGVQYRGVSELVASIGWFADVKRIHDWELRAHNIQSAYALVESNETGEPEPPGSDSLSFPSPGTSTSGTASGLVYKTYESGLHKYFRANSGAQLQLVTPNRPGGDSQLFHDRTTAQALYGIEWDPNFSLAIKEPGGAWARAIIEKVRRGVKNNQRCEAQAMHYEGVWALSIAIDLGLLRAPSDGDIFSWDYHGPARITADSGNEEKGKRDAYKLGTITMRDLMMEQGKWWTETREQRQQEVADLLERAAQLQASYPQLTFADILNLLEQRSPNPLQGIMPEPIDSEPMPDDVETD